MLRKLLQWPCTTVGLANHNQKHAILKVKMVLAQPQKPKQASHDKKRHGLHHKQSKHYSQTYWPYLPMLLVVVAGFILNTTWQAGKGILGYATNVSVSSLLQETNIQRSNHGKTALTLNSQLSQAAQDKANDMVARNYWAHTTPDGKQPWEFISATGYSFTAAGENLAYGFDSSAAAMTGWMNSPGHKANVLHDNYLEVGFGVANSPDYQSNGEQTVIVAMYAKPQKVVTPSTATTGRAPAPAPKPAPVAEESAPAAEQPAAPPAESTPTPAATSEPTQVTPESVGATDPEPLSAKQVARIDILTSGNAQWAGLAVSLLASLAVLWFIVQHARVWKRFLLRGETFFIKHPLFDLAIVAFGVLAFLLTRTSGFIQ